MNFSSSRFKLVHHDKVLSDILVLTKVASCTRHRGEIELPAQIGKDSSTHPVLSPLSKMEEYKIFNDNVHRHIKVHRSSFKLFVLGNNFFV